MQWRKNDDGSETVTKKVFVKRCQRFWGMSGRQSLWSMSWIIAIWIMASLFSTSSLIVFAQPTSMAEPGEGAFHDPAFGKNLKPTCSPSF